MTHPGIAVFVAVGIGLGAMLYYLFAKQENQQQHSRAYRPSNWSPPPSHNNTRRRSRCRRQDKVCSICLDEPNKENGVRIVPCTHIFHKQCIEKWRTIGAESRPSCPMCRNKIEDLDEL